MEKIKITCRSQKLIPLGDLVEFQGNLKETDPDRIRKLKNLILEHGFSFPVFIWKNNILDGHQRIRALQELIADGHEFDGMVPIDEIEAKSEKEAAKKLLAVSSQFARITHGGLAEFVGNFEIDLTDIADIEIPDIDFDDIFGDAGTDAPIPDDNKDIDEDEMHNTKNECPKCGFKW